MTRIIFFLAMFASCSVLAFMEDATDVYQVEVIFFAHTNQNRFTAEKWPKFVGKLDTRNSIALSSLKKGMLDSLEPDQTPMPITVTLLDNKKLLLNEQTRTIQKSKDYQLIDHVGWTQPLVNRSLPILIHSGKKNELDALIDIKPAGRNQFIVNVDMLFNTDNKEFRITRNVKVKNKELYYIDHPILSAMIIVSPVASATEANQ